MLLRAKGGGGFWWGLGEDVSSVRGGSSRLLVYGREARTEMDAGGVNQEANGEETQLNKSSRERQVLPSLRKKVGSRLATWENQMRNPIDVANPVY